MTAHDRKVTFRQWAACDPKAEILLLDYPVRAHQDRLRNCDAERLGSLQVDHKFKLGRLINWEVARFRAPEDLVH
jgi:hypothetical protein